MIAIVSTHLIKKGFLGFACWPFVVVKDRKLLKSSVFCNHERIHLRQQIELLVIPFFLWYLTEYIINYCRFNNSYRAYRSISFEREAYRHERDLKYLKSRKIWAFLKFI